MLRILQSQQISLVPVSRGASTGAHTLLLSPSLRRCWKVKKKPTFFRVRRPRRYTPRAPCALECAVRLPAFTGRGCTVTDSNRSRSRGRSLCFPETGATAHLRCVRAILLSQLSVCHLPYAPRNAIMLQLRIECEPRLRVRPRSPHSIASHWSSVTGHRSPACDGPRLLHFEVAGIEDRGCSVYTLLGCACAAVALSPPFRSMHDFMNPFRFPHLALDRSEGALELGSRDVARDVRGTPTRSHTPPSHARRGGDGHWALGVARTRAHAPVAPICRSLRVGGVGNVGLTEMDGSSSKPHPHGAHEARDCALTLDSEISKGGRMMHDC